jgi:(p)ppGpp synthase/HD superfamily hydrolase
MDEQKEGSPMILRAARFAREAHHNQGRKWSADAYILHPARVASRVSLLEDATEEMVAAAWMHDILEDTPVEAADVEWACGEKVMRMVVAMTNPAKRSRLPRAERKKIDREHLMKQSPEVKMIKMLDRIDNLRDLPGAPAKFKKLYASESLLLAEVVGDADELLKGELIYWARRVGGSCANGWKGESRKEV